MKLYFHFLVYILEPLNEFNTMIQADGSKIGYLNKEMDRLLRKFLGRFVKAKVIQSSDDLTNVPYFDEDSMLQDNIIAVGMYTRSYLAEQQDDIPTSVIKRFFQAVRKFYSAVVGKMLAKFPFNDPVVASMGFLNPERRGDEHVNSVLSIVQRFPSVTKDIDLLKLEEEYLEFSVSSATDLPAFIPTETRIDEFWGNMASLKNKVTDTPTYPNLCKVASQLMTTGIPNSNADCERLFSMVRKIQTENRMSMDNDTICSLLTCKVNFDSPCFTFNPSKDTLRKAKSATFNYNREHITPN